MIMVQGLLMNVYAAKHSKTYIYDHLEDDIKCHI